MLTQKQLDLLQFIHARVQKDGVPPSFDEMKEALDLRSKSGIHRLITALEERGFIRRLAHKARAIEIVKLPETLENKGFQPKVIQGERPEGPRPGGAFPVEAVAANLVPLLGKVAAGGPIHAVPEQKTEISVPPNLLAGNGPHYALEVDGDSMIEAGINPGDVVIIREGTTADNGDIVVAAFQDHEEYVVTLKKFYLKDKRVALEAANPRYETRIIPKDKVEVRGRLVGLIRSY